MFTIFLEVLETDTKQNRLHKYILYAWLTLIIIISLNKLNVYTKSIIKEILVLMVMNDKILFIIFRFFISYIELLFIIINQYIYECEICCYPIMSYILQILLFCIIILYNSQKSLVFYCCGCIWLRETLFQTWKRVLIIPKDIIQDSMNLVSTDVPYSSWSQKSTSKIYLLHDWH